MSEFALLPAVEIETAGTPDAAVIFLHGLGDDGHGWPFGHGSSAPGRRRNERRAEVSEGGRQRHGIRDAGGRARGGGSGSVAATTTTARRRHGRTLLRHSLRGHGTTVSPFDMLCKP